jgi:hypothetical protein
MNFSGDDLVRGGSLCVADEQFEARDDHLRDAGV